MAALLQQQGGALRGKRVLELGAGTGIGGLSAAACGADVLLSDQAHMLALLNENIAANGLQVQAAQWRTPCALRHAPSAMQPCSLQPSVHCATVPPCHRASLHHAPCTMYDASCVLHPVPDTVHPVPDTCSGATPTPVSLPRTTTSPSAAARRWRSMVRVPPLGSAPARLLCLLRARLAALGSSALSG